MGGSTRRRRRPGRGAGRPGQNLVEFALALPLLALILVGAADLGRVFFYQTRLTNSLIEGAYYASHFPDQTSTIISRAYAEANGKLGTTGTDFVISSSSDIKCYQGFTTTLITTTPAGDCTAKDASGVLYVKTGDSIEITGRYTFRPITSTLVRLLPANYQIRKTVRMVVQ